MIERCFELFHLLGKTLYFTTSMSISELKQLLEDFSNQSNGVRSQTHQYDSLLNNIGSRIHAKAVSYAVLLDDMAKRLP